jgi:hypothetical protein
MLNVVCFCSSYYNIYIFYMLYTHLYVPESYFAHRDNLYIFVLSLFILGVFKQLKIFLLTSVQDELK